MRATGEPDADRAESLSVVICAYTTRRWFDLCRSAQSVLGQQWPTLELIVVIDHCDELFVRACTRFSSDERVTVVTNTEARGLSGARNTGIGVADGDVIAFVDDDARAEPGWAPALMRHYRNRDVAGVGGYAVPNWPGGRPMWLPREFDWVVGCSYVGQPTQVARVRNPIGCNTSMRRSVLDVVGGFRSEVGRVGTIPVGGEETELCIRIGGLPTSNQIIFDPDIFVHHSVSTDRVTLRYFVSRCHHEGKSKAVVAELTSTSNALRSEHAYTMHVLPRAVLREGASMTTGGLKRASVMLLGFSVTATGYVQCRTGIRLRRVWKRWMPPRPA